MSGRFPPITMTATATFLREFSASAVDGGVDR